MSLTDSLPDWLDFDALYDDEAKAAEIIDLAELMQEPPTPKAEKAEPKPKPQLPSDDRPRVTWDVDEGREVTDDEEIDWWELHDAGKPVAIIARKFRRMPETIILALLRLDVFQPRTPWEERFARDFHAEQRIRQTIAESDDPQRTARAFGFLERRKKGKTTAQEEALFEALGKLGEPFRREGIEGRALPFARALDHVKPDNLGKRRPRTPMSAHERGQHRLGWGRHRSQIRNELRAAGLLPSSRYIRTSSIGRYFF